MKTLWKNVCTAVCMCVLSVWVTSCPQSVGSGGGGAPITTLYVSVTDSIGGTAVDGTTLKVYESGTAFQYGSDYTVTDGKVRISGLPINKRYDFELIGIKGKWAGSRLENYTPLKEREQTLSIIQSEHDVITRGITPPKITSVQSGNGTFTDIDENTVISPSDKVRIVFESDVGAVEGKSSGAFGAKLGIDKAPNLLSGVYGNYSVSQTGGIFKSAYTFSFSELPDGKAVLIAVGYDIAHNRIEKHIPVTFQGSAAPASDLSTCQFEQLMIYTERVPFSENLFSLKPVEGRRSAYKVFIRFKFTKAGTDERILGFDLYRKEKNSPEDFRFVSRTLYKDLKAQSGAERHIGIDSDSLLDENKEYEYKIKAFNKTNEKYSSAITTKLLESFTYDLTAPAKNAVVSFDQASHLVYECKISNTNLFKAEQSDFMSFGLLINDWRGIPKFGAILSYAFNLGGHPDIIIEVCDEATGALAGRKTVSDLIANGKLNGVSSINDLVIVDKTTGAVKFTEKFVKVPIFNVVSIDGIHGLNTPLVYEKGTSYQWDIQDWGTSALSLNDDEALSFIKLYPYTDDAGNSYYYRTVSYGNNRTNGANAVNGRFTFTVAD